MEYLTSLYIGRTAIKALENRSVEVTGIKSKLVKELRDLGYINFKPKTISIVKLADDNKKEKKYVAYISNNFRKNTFELLLEKIGKDKKLYVTREIKPNGEKF